MLSAKPTMAHRHTLVAGADPLSGIARSDRLTGLWARAMFLSALFNGPVSQDHARLHPHDTVCDQPTIQEDGTWEYTLPIFTPLFDADTTLALTGSFGHFRMRLKSPLVSRD
ncbi:hypothetical protein ASF22_03860 [Methylobacterium sp. Leaf87]|uniref:hypothetical protein n=1 Tax=Methylobacterium sp. Leaf87 TaxID=1736243 RepID=UPI0006FC7C48|nr:hypothetical protein [Methylobacterium sp. Leaf87]KQO69728.1 hypothetical protein ASF22_03860 [Methylobacterium sp. Leaf87]